MFDIGFTELLLIAIIGLVVLGPERLPGAIRTTAYWIGKIRGSFQNAKEELERELDVDGIKQQIHNEAVMRELEKARGSLNEPLQMDSLGSADVDKKNDNSPETGTSQEKPGQTI